MMEQWLAENWYHILIIVALASIAFWRIYILEITLGDHLNRENKSPHPSCPVHTEKFAQVIKTIESIDKRIATLDNRIYSFMRMNGFHTDDQ